MNCYVFFTHEIQINGKLSIVAQNKTLIKKIWRTMKNEI